MECELCCPYCGEPSSVWIDESGGDEQRYVEDCPVCCRPWAVAVWRDDDGTLVASASRHDA